MAQAVEQTPYKGLMVEEGITKLIAVHNGQPLTFLHPAFGPDTYAGVGLSMEQAGLKRPTMAETASLAHAAFNSDDNYSKEIKNIIDKAWLWAFTGNLYVPKEGVYIQDDPQIRNGMPFMEESELVKKLEANDPGVRFVPFGYQIGEMTPSKLAKNAYFIGLAGEEGAEKLAEVAGKYKYNPHLWSFESEDEPLIRVSAVDSSRYLEHRLYVYGDDHGNNRDGRAFGVLRKTGEASRAKK